MGLIKEYCELYDVYDARFPNTIVLMQVGSFYELYGTDNGRGCKDMRQVCDLLNIQLTRKNKNVVGAADEGNPWMAGFPCVALDKYLPLLLESNHHVVLYEQTSLPPNPTRAVTRVISKGTCVDMAKTSASHNISAYYFETVPCTVGGRRVFAGYATLDMATGTCSAGELLSPQSDPEWALDELYRMKMITNPVECVMLCASHEKDCLRADHVLKRMECDAGVTTMWWGDGFDKTLLETAYHEQVFAKVYASQGLTEVTTVCEALGLDQKRCAAIALTSVFRFAYQHDETFMQRVNMPTVNSWCSRSHMSMCYNSIRQLGVLVQNRAGKLEPCLMSVLNRTKTGMGYRLFHDYLVIPSTDVNELVKRYDLIDAMLQGDRYGHVREKLGQVSDVERLLHRALAGKLTVAGLHNIMHSMRVAAELHVNNAALISGLLDVTFNSDAIASGHKQIFKHGFSPMIDDLNVRLNEKLEQLQAIAEAFQGKIEGMDRIVTTQKRFTETRKLSDDRQLCIGEFRVPLSEFHAVKSTGTYVKLEHVHLSRALDDVRALERELDDALTALFMEFMRNFVVENQQKLESIVHDVSVLDVSATCALNAREYCYHRPSPRAQKQAKSWLDARAVRHPVVERVRTDVRYVTNDVSLGCNGCNGMLLYGLNAAGKSCLTKAVALNLVMAQAGMFVACDSFDFVPYNKVFSRVATGDDAFKNQSTFTLEMSELKNILCRADACSLVIGDELCAGTEQTSALAIVASGVLHLTEVDASYMFATHLHELTNIHEVSSAHGLKLMHLSCRLDADNKLTYERKLKPGSGDTLYGLEVCRALKLPGEFIRRAQTIRHRLVGNAEQLVRTTRSRYNSKVFMDVCIKCKARMATETHHIIPQHMADSHGYIKQFHKHVSHNLMPLCDTCHKDEHVLLK